MTYDPTNLFGAPSRLSPAVRALGYSGSPLPLDEWLKLRETIRSSLTDGGLKRVFLPPAIVSCAQCGEMTLKQAFEISKSERRGLKEFYCSNACWGRSTNLKRHGARLCVRCEAPALRNASFGTTQTGRIFCSRECMSQEREEEFEQRALARMRPCGHCNAMFIPTSATHQFCGRDCADRAHAGRMKGENNPRWQDGASASRVKPHVTKRFREMRPLVMRRDGQRCVLCGATGSLEVHHIDENPLNNRALNLATLCRPCHMRVHFSEEKTTLSERLKTHAATPMSTTYRFKKRAASLLKEC